jgi:hypothetical protein
MTLTTVKTNKSKICRIDPQATDPKNNAEIDSQISLARDSGEM